MSDDIKTRLKSASEECQKCYEVWSGDDKNDKAREALQDAIHELRKVASRLEIELAISERDQLKQRPLPIPPHRDAKNRSRAAAENENAESERPPRRSLGGSGSQGGSSSSSSSAPNVERKPQRRTRPAQNNDDNKGNAE